MKFSKPPSDDATYGSQDVAALPSRSQRRRAALAVLALAERLVALPPSEVEHLPLSPAVQNAVHETQRIHSHIARKRQLQYLAKLLRAEEEDALERARALLAHDRLAARRAAADLHRIEHWRDRLMTEGDSALAELLAEHSDADRQRLRQLARQAHAEQRENRPPHAFRELFRVLRELLGVDNVS